MKNIVKFILFGLVFTLLSSCEKDLLQPTVPCTDETVFTINENHPKAGQIQAVMNEYLAKGIPGMTVLINDDDGMWYASAGFADLENQIPMQPCHINKLGSVTKMMMGALIWQLVQEGQLDINEPISTYLPEVASRLPFGSQITLGMLVNHSSGVYDIARDLGYNLAVINDFTRSWTAEEILDFVEGKPATHEPGTDVSYSNTNTLLEALIIEKVTGVQHGQLLKERIFDPLGMESTVYYDYSEAFPINRLAQGYLDFNNDGGAIQNISKLNPGSGTGYTGVYSTVTDLYRFMKALLQDKTLTSEDNLDFIFDNMTVGGESWKSSFGGIHDEFRLLFDEDFHVYGHAGGDIGFSANLNYIPENNTIYAATFNYGTNLPSALGDELSNLRKALIEIMAAE